MKKCSKCQIEQDCSGFSKDRAKSDGLCTVCKSCRKGYMASYYSDPDNRKKAVENAKRYWSENKEAMSERAKQRYLNNIETIRVKRKEKYWSDPESAKLAAKEYSLKRRWEDPVYRMSIRCRKRCWEAFSQKGYTKRSKTFDLIGCSQEDLSNYLESMFKPGMSWDNYGKWHIDHIVPLSSASSSEEVESLCHYSNLQPMWAEENLRKGARVDYCAD